MLFRIQTESSSEYDSNIIDIIRKHYDNFTLIHAKGYYKGKPESSLIIEIIIKGFDNDNKAIVEHICDMIIFTNKQESVLLTRFDDIKVKFHTV